MAISQVSWPGWETVRLIGRGSFGAVYEIQRDVLGILEKAALKVISIPQNSFDIDDMYNDGYTDAHIAGIYKSRLKSIINEYSLMRKMNGSANVVNCDDIRYVQHKDGIGWDIFIKMELLTPLGTSLPADIPEATVIRIAEDLCNALELCKKHDIVHRDIKPQNIFVSPNGDYKLGDFGIAKTVEKTMGGTKIGTYKYMAPEVYHDQPYGSTADIYSLGLVLYWLLNDRRTPFMPPPSAPLRVGAEEQARMRRFSGEPLPPPSHGSEGLQRIVLKACAYAPEDRYQSAWEMWEDLQKLSCGALPVFDIGSEQETEIVTDTGSTEQAEEDAVSRRSIAAGMQAAVQAAGGFLKRLVKQSHKKEPQAPKPVSDKANGSRKKLIAVSALCVAIILILLLLRTCGAGAPTEDNLSATAQWSQWADALPENVTSKDYLIEEQTLYRSRRVNLTSSTTQDTMEGWELYDIRESGDGYGQWSEWSADMATASESRQVEEQPFYHYRDKEFTTGSSSSKNGWTHYNTTYSWGDWGTWSAWSANKATASDSRQVETKTQYRYADKITTTSSSSSLSGWTLSDTTYDWGNWGSWSGWSENAATASDSKQVETASRYRYYAYICSNCGARIPYQQTVSYGICYTEFGGCGGTGYSTSYSLTYLTNPPSDATYWKYNKRYLISGGLRWFINTGKDPVTVYRYRTRSQVATYHFWQWGDWSDWLDSKYTASDTRKVETRTLYRYCDRTQIPTYHFWQWGDWSEWSATAVSETENRQVESATHYRYRDIVTHTTWFFRQYEEWSAYDTTPVEASDTLQVETVTQYRYKRK